MPGDSADSWASVLDELEDRLAVYASTLRGAPSPPVFVIPAGIGRLPAELRDRAALTRDRQLDLENRMRDRLATLRAISTGHSVVPNSIYVDTRA